MYFSRAKNPFSVLQPYNKCQHKILQKSQNLSGGRYTSRHMKRLIIAILTISTSSFSIAGAWDYGPRDNDAALDLILELEQSRSPINDISIILDTYGEGYESEVRFACDYLINELRENIQSSSKVSECINLISRYYNDPEYLEAWDDENNIKKALLKQIKELESYGK